MIADIVALIAIHGLVALAVHMNSQHEEWYRPHMAVFWPIEMVKFALVRGLPLLFGGAKYITANFWAMIKAVIFDWKY